MEEWEIGYSKENPSIKQPLEVKTANFDKPETLLGETIDGRFLIEKDLTEGGADKGGIGLVYLAEDLKHLKRKVVVKILQKAALENENVVRKFQHEKEALIRLDHQNIIRLLDSGQLSDGNSFLVLEFIEGYSLNSKLQKEKVLSLAECAYLVEKISNALRHAHSKKILHRDLKPANVMLTPQDEIFDHVRLIDFGIARVENPALAPATRMPQAMGTLAYMAPEQLEGKIDQNPAVDVYALAVMTYKMLTGSLPYLPENEVQLHLLQVQGLQKLPSQIRPEISETVDALIRQGLDYDPKNRPQDIREFGQNLANALRKTDNPGRNHSPGNIIAQPPGDSANENVVPSPTMPSIPPVAPAAQFVNDREIPEIGGRRKSGSRKFPLIAALGLLIAAALGALAAFILWKNSQIPAATNKDTSNSAAANPVLNTNSNKSTNAPRRELSFYLNVQKMRDGKPFEEPFRSSGQEIFESGYKFKMNIKPDADGFVYLFNEAEEQNSAVYNILYPTPKTNNGSAQTAGKQAIETNFNSFGGTKGTELIWIIWTADKQDDLEAARQSAFNANGIVKDEKSLRQLKDFLQKHGSEKTEVRKDSANQQTILQGNGDVIVYRLELEHR